MSDALFLAMALAVGLLLGLMFFGGLWWTVRKGLTSPYPAVWFMTSMALRTGLTLFGFYLVSAGHWERLVMCLVGFIAARFAVSWATRRIEASRLTTMQEVHHEPEP